MFTIYHIDVAGVIHVLPSHFYVFAYSEMCTLLDQYNAFLTKYLRAGHISYSYDLTP